MITDLGLAWLDQRLTNKPFFLMLQYKAPHDSFRFAPRYSGYLDNVDIPEPPTLYDQDGFGSAATRGVGDSLRGEIGTSISKRVPDRNLGIWMGVDPDLPDRDYTRQAYQEYLKRYLRTVKGVDDNIGRVIAFLKRQGLYEDTIIIYTSDQGLMLGEHDLADKRWIYEESIRMPLIIRNPDIKDAPKQSELLINNTDFAPTLLDFAGIDAPASMQGRSFAGAMRGRAPDDWRNASYYRFWMHRAYHDVPAHFGLRTLRYKLAFFYGTDYFERTERTKEDYFGVELPRNEYYGVASVREGDSLPRSYMPTPPGWEFYDLSIDPQERVNRYDDPQYRDVISELKRDLLKLRDDLNETDAKYPAIEEIIEAHWD